MPIDYEVSILNDDHILFYIQPTTVNYYNIIWITKKNQSAAYFSILHVSEIRDLQKPNIR